MRLFCKKHSFVFSVYPLLFYRLYSCSRRQSTSMLNSAAIRIVYLALMFLASLVLSKIVSPGQFGAVSLIILNASLLSIVTGLGADSLMLHKVASGKWLASEAVHFAAITAMLQFVLFLSLESGTLLLFKRTLLSGEAPSFFGADAVYFTGLLLTEKCLALLYAFQKARVANVLLTLAAVAYLCALLTLSFFSNVNLTVAVHLFAFQSLLQGTGLLLAFYLNVKTERKKGFHFFELVGLLRSSSVVMITNVIQLFAYRIDFWLLDYFHGNDTVGIYAMANKFAALVWVIPNIVAQLLIPKFAQMTKEEAAGFFSAAFWNNLLGAAGASVCIAAVYFYYLDAAYRPGLSAFFLMLPGYFFWAAVLYYAAYFSWAGKFSENFLCSLSCFVFILLADVLLIPKYGIKGAACANSFAYSAVFGLCFWRLKRRFSFTAKALLLPPRKNFFRIIKWVTD